MLFQVEVDFFFAFNFSSSFLHRLFEELKNQHTTEKAKLTDETRKLKEQLSEVEQKLKHDRDKYAELKVNYQRQKDCNM